jgi:S1-C subfamily serine protease
VVVRVNNREVTGVADVQAEVEDARRNNRPTVLLWVSRNGQSPIALAVRLQARPAAG